MANTDMGFTSDSSINPFEAFTMDKFDLLNGLDGYSDNWFQTGVTGQGAETGNDEYGTMLSQQGRTGLESLFGPNASYNFGTVDGMATGDFNVLNDRGRSQYGQQFTPDGGGFMSDFMNTVMPAAVGGFLTGGVGLENMFAKGALQGGLTSGMTGGDVAKGALSGGLSAGIPGVNTGNTYLNSAATGALRGAAGSALSGGDIMEGAIRGGVGNLAGTGVSQGVKAMGNMFAPDTSYAGTGDFARVDRQNDMFPYGGQSMGQYEPSPTRAYLSEMMGQTLPNASNPVSSNQESPWSGFFAGAPTEQAQDFGGSNDFGGGFSMPSVSNAPIGGSGMTADMGTWMDSDMGRKFRELLGMGGQFAAKNSDQIAKGLMGLYGYNKANKAYKQQIGGLQGMFGPNSPYAQQMRQSLERKDAAAGRRSQYGPREVELQARLAEMNSRNAPQLAQLYAGQNQNRDRLLNTAYQIGKPYLSQMFQPTQRSFGPQLDNFFTNGSSGD